MLRKYLCFFAPLLVAFSMTSAFATAERAAKVISNFNNEAELARFVLRGIPQQSLVVSTGDLAQGEKCARFTFAKWRSGMDEWPAMSLSTSKELPKDWSGYDSLVVDVRNNSKCPIDLAYFVGDLAGDQIGKHFAVAPGEAKTLNYPLCQMRSVSLSSIREIRLYATRPADDISLSIGRLRLEEDLDSRLTWAQESLNGLKKKSKLPEVVSLLSETEKVCRDLKAQLTSAPSAEARQAMRPTVLAFEQNVRIKVPRTISEMLLRSDFKRIDARVSYACGFASSMEKVFPRDIPFNAKVSRISEIDLAGNETEAVQLLILAGKEDLKNVQVSVSKLSSADAFVTPNIPSAKVSPMGFVNTPPPPYKSNYIGWYPDPILDFLKSFNIKAQELQPVWIEVKTPAGTPAGLYTGEITIEPANAPAVKFALKVNVWGFDVPKEAHLRTALSMRDQPIQQVYGSLTDRMWTKYCNFVLDHRLNPDNIYNADPPKMADLIRWNRRGLNAFNITYVVKPSNIEPGAPYPEEKKKEILARLDAIIPQLKANGLYEKAYVYGFDEIHPEIFNAMKDIFSAIKAKYPDLLLMTTAYDASYGEATGLNMVDAWVPLTPSYNPARAHKVREKGKQVWWYICIGPKAPYANWLIEYDVIDARSLMGLQTAKYQPDGFLYYALDRWPLSKKPITEGPYTDWPTQSCADWNGDGSVLCAGPDGPLTTIRLENIRDGLEDYEYFWLLRQEIKRLQSNHTPEAVMALARARTALNIGDDLVKHPTQFSKSPSAIYAKRRQVAEGIMECRKVSDR